MPVAKLKRVKIRNWEKIAETELEFPDQGLVLVSGSNLAANGSMESVGAGKTSLGEAISRAVVGVDGRFSSTGHYSTDEAGNTLVEVELAVGGQPLVVQYGYKCPELSRTGEGLRFRLGDEEVWRDHVRSTREELVKTINVTPELAQWTVFIDGEKLKFGQLSQRQLVDLLLAALGQPPWTRYHEQAKSVLGKFKTELELAADRRRRATAELLASETSVGEAGDKLAGEEKALAKKTAEHAEQCQSQSARKAKAKAELERLEARRQAAVKKIKEIENAKAGEYHRLEVERTSLGRKTRLAQEFKDKRLESMTKASGNLAAVQRTMCEMLSVPANCPTCGKAWDKKHAKSEIDRQAEAVKTAELAKRSAEDLHAAAAADLKSYARKLAEAEAAVKALNVDAPVRRLSDEIEQLSDVDIPAAYAKLSELESLPPPPSESQVLAAKAVLAERRAKMASAKTALEHAAVAQVEAETALKVINYWTEAYSPYGIPNMVLKRSLTPLNDVSRRLSNLLTGGTIEITYETTRELASGRDKPELAIRVKNRLGARRLEGNSKGEAGLTDLIIAETLSEVGCVSNRLGYRFYDEVVKTQDPVVRRAVFSYLKETARRLGILIFVVDHSPEIANYADRVLLAEKTVEHGTRFRWL